MLSPKRCKRKGKAIGPSAHLVLNSLPVLSNSPHPSSIRTFACNFILLGVGNPFGRVVTKTRRSPRVDFGLAHVLDHNLACSCTQFTNLSHTLKSSFSSVAPFHHVSAGAQQGLITFFASSASPLTSTALATHDWSRLTIDRTSHTELGFGISGGLFQAPQPPAWILLASGLHCRGSSPFFPFRHLAPNLSHPCPMQTSTDHEQSIRAIFPRPLSSTI